MISRIPRIAAALAAIILLTLVVSRGSAQPAKAQTDDQLIEARITAEQQEDGRVKVALELRRDSTDWDDRLQPQLRYLRADAPINAWRHSEPLPSIEGVPGRLRIAARRIPYGHVELALQRDLGAGWGNLQLPRARQLDSPRYGPDRFATSSIDLVDNGPQRCRLGLILGPRDRCRFPDTRDELIVQADGVLRYPIDPYNAAGVEYDDGTFTPTEWRTYFVVPFLHGAPIRESTQGVQIESLRNGKYIILHLGLDRLHPANGAVCAPGLLVRFGHYCGMQLGYVWFIVYPHGPAHLTVPTLEISRISDGELHVEIAPRGNVGRQTFHAIPEADGWRITTLEAPDPPPLPITPIDIGYCYPGLIVGPGQSCSDPNIPSTFWVDVDGRWGWNDGLTSSDSSGLTVINHPNGHSNGFRKLSAGRWLVSDIHHAGVDLKEAGSCIIGRVVYPGEQCSSTGPSWFAVYPNGLASYGNIADRNRVSATDVRIRYSDGTIDSYDFTAERQDDGSFRVVHMHQRRLQLERQVERQLGDCKAGLILGPGDGCRYPEYGDLFVVRYDGSAIVGANSSYDSSGAVRFDSWERGTGYILHRPLSDKRRIILAVADDMATSLGVCTLGAAVQPGQKCRPRPDLPELHVFEDAAFYDDTASTGNLLVEQPDLNLRLRAERQPNGAYVIRQIDAE